VATAPGGFILQSAETGLSQKNDIGDIANSDHILRPLLKSQVRSILIKGEPGTGKTTLALELLRLYGKGIYVSTRLSKEQSEEQHPALGGLFGSGNAIEISAQDIDGDQLEKASAGYSFQDLRFSEPKNVINALIKGVQRIKEPLIILDSWDAIANRTDRVERLKVEQSLALLALGNNAKLLFISEEPSLTTTDYLVDAVVTVQNDLYEGRRIRKILWNKVRGSATTHWSNLFTLSEGRFTAFSQHAALWQRLEKPLPFEPIPHKDPFYSSGSADFDEFMGGGLRKGFLIVVEYGKYLGSAAFNPISTAIRCNFILNDGCSVTIPSPGVSANRIKDSVVLHVPSKLLDTSLRLAYFELFDVDPCFFALNPSSPGDSFDKLMSESIKVKGDKNRPCVFSIGGETLENAYSREEAFRFAQAMVQRVRHFGDVLYIILRHSSSMVNELSNLSDIHIKLDDLEGTTVIERLKPWSQLYSIVYDYSHGYPKIKLVPFV
jgi:KaiC/GvpD/RAD55 family RecA-like ATPase